VVVLHALDERLLQELQIVPDNKALALLASLAVKKDERKEERHGRN
jgi:hypothetical protein